MAETKRVEWIDTLRALGIIAIYVGHFLNSAGKLYPFVFTYHVPLFFLISGLFAKKTDESFIKYIKKQFLHLMVPYYGFVLLNLAVFILQSNPGAAGIVDMIKQGFMGIRNNIFASSLWFIPCLFIMSVIYNAISRLIKNKYIILVIAAAVHFLSRAFLPGQPSWFWNIDSALVYLIYYAAGAAFSGYIIRFRFSEQKLPGKLLLVFVVLFACAVSAVTYFKGASFFTDLSTIIPVKWLISLTIAFVGIFVNMMAAFILREIKLLQNIGKSTLALCGTEQMLKLILTVLLGLIGITVSITSALGALIYTVVCVVINYYTLVRLTSFFPVLYGKWRHPGWKAGDKTLNG